MKVQLEQSFIYELNTRIFCKENSCALETFSDKFFLTDEFKACDYLWLMGVWAPSPLSKKICNNHGGLLNEFKKALPDLTPNDIVGSPYAIFLYEPNTVVANSLDEILRFKNKINLLGKKLILDFVPNHMAADTPLIVTNPECFLKGKIEDKDNPNFFQHESGEIFTHGRDPFFDGWTDTVQWDFSNPNVYSKHLEILSKISEVCDGIRCDMAMLPEENVFFRTHGKKALAYWKPLIAEIKSKKKDFIFIAEVYWNMEYDLQQKGFDFTYDKELYDRMKKNPEEIHSHLNAEDSYQRRSLRFLENHDEERAMEAFGERSIDLFSILTFLPGMILYHEGQTSGLKKKLPVQLGRRSVEITRADVSDFYERALSEIIYRKGKILNIEKFVIIPYSGNELSKVIALCLVGQGESLSKPEILIYNPFLEKIKGKFEFTGTILDWTRSYEREVFSFKDIISNSSFTGKKSDILEHGLYIELEGNKGHWFVFE